MGAESILRRVLPSPNPSLPQFQDRTQGRLADRDRMARSAPIARIPTSSSSSTSNRSKKPLRPLPSTVNHDNPLIHIDRTARSLQKHIQRLLDAQSEGLVAGLGGDQNDDGAGTSGSLTPTATPTQSVSGSITTTAAQRISTSISTWSVPTKQTQLKSMPVRQPPKKKITLHSARTGLTRSLHDFSVLKSEESHILAHNLLEREDALQHITAYENKQSSIRNEISSIENGTAAESLGALHTSESSLTSEIQDLELKLQALKNRHRVLKSQIRERESELQSTVSSFRGSLELLRNEIQGFLRKPPVTSPFSSYTSDNGSDSTTPLPFYALNPQRRTLQLARECWTEECVELTRRNNAVIRDRQALLDGERMWSETVTEISEFESEMQRKMQHSALDPEGEIKDILKDMDGLVANLEVRLQKADEEGWKLMVCAVGAEVEALREGRLLLREVVGEGGGGVKGGESEPLGMEGIDGRAAGEFKSETEPLKWSSSSLKGKGKVKTPDRGPLIDEDLEQANHLPEPDNSDVNSSRPRALPFVSDGTTNTNRNGAISASSESEDDDPPPELIIDGGHGHDNDENDALGTPRMCIPPAPATTNGAVAGRGEVSESEDEIEGPGPEFLVSHE